ncbi:MAG: hypothetical protein ACRDND_17395 [Streptosporangiaceae bacterium]
MLTAPGNVTLWSTNTSKQTYAVIQLPAHGWGPDQFGCLNSIWVRERLERAGRASGVRLRDPAGRPGQQDGRRRFRLAHQPADQIRWGEDYIHSRYSTPCQAWAYWQARKYYGPLLAVVLGAD